MPVVDFDIAGHAYVVLYTAHSPDADVAIAAGVRPDKAPRVTRWWPAKDDAALEAFFRRVKPDGVRLRVEAVLHATGHLDPAKVESMTGHRVPTPRRPDNPKLREFFRAVEDVAAADTEPVAAPLSQKVAVYEGPPISGVKVAQALPAGTLVRAGGVTRWVLYVGVREGWLRHVGPKTWAVTSATTHAPQRRKHGRPGGG